MSSLAIRGFILALLLTNVSATNISQSIQRIDAGTFIWSIEIPPIESKHFTSEGLHFESWNTGLDHRGLQVPTLSKLIYTRSLAPELSYDLQLSTHAMVHPAPDQHDLAKGMDFSAPIQPGISDDYVTLELISETATTKLWSVSITGGQYDPDNGSWSIPAPFDLRIQTDLLTPDMTTDSHLFLNQVAASPNNHSETLSASETGKMKLYCLEDGIYRIYYDSLATDPDFPEEDIASVSLSVSHKGESIPIYVFDDGDAIFDDGDYFDFIGKRNYFEGSSQYFDPFSDISVYWLDWGSGSGLRFIEESGALLDTNPVRPTSFWDTAHVEKDSIFDRLGQVDTNLPTITRDHYFWASVNSGQRIDVPFYLADPTRGSSENLQISMGLHGLTYSDDGGSSDHQLFAFVNDNSIGEGNWHQQEAYILESPTALNLSHNILSASGSNTLSIFAPVSTEPGNYDRIVLDWMRIGYEHALMAHSDALRFRKSFINPSTDLEYEIKGFTEPELVIYKEGLSKITGFDIRENWDSSAPEYSLVFQDRSTAATPDYWVASNSGLLQPVLTQMDTTANLRNEDGNLIIITTPDFVDDLEDYLEFKISQGWDPIAISVVDVYDEFNHGINSPFAIKSFLQYAYLNWPSHPEYVLLIGDAISNPQQTKRDTDVRNIPTFYMQTYGWGAAEADYWYSLLVGEDYLPDVNIGRIPCSNSEDFQISMQKLIRYGSGENHGRWQNEIVTIAGFESTFKSQSESLLRNQIPQSMIPSRVFIDRDSEGQIFWGDTDSLVALWNAGKQLINFLGHGGGAVWADRSLFVRDDIQYLDPETPPAFVTSMTCFTGSFAQSRGLGEVVLTESPAGAIGWFGSSGVGWLINDHLMVQPLLSKLLTEDAPIGKLINEARMEYYLASGYEYLKPSMLFQYNFLGDPTTRLNLPEPAEILSTSKTIYSSTDQISLTLESSETGSLSILPVDAHNEPWLTAPRVYDSAISQHYVFDQEQAAPNGSGRSIYTLDRGTSQSALQGAVHYSVNSDWFEHTPPPASLLGPNEPIPIVVKYHNIDSSADSLVLTFSGGYSGEYSLNETSTGWILSDTLRIPLGPSTISYRFSAWNSGILLSTSSNYRLDFPQSMTLRIETIKADHQDHLVGTRIHYFLEGQDSALGNLSYVDHSPTFDQSKDVSVTLHEGRHSLFIPSYFGSDTVHVQISLSLDGPHSIAPVFASATFKTNYRQIIPNLGITLNGTDSDTVTIWGDNGLFSKGTDTAWVKIMTSLEALNTGPGLILIQDSMIVSYESGINDPGLSLVNPQGIFMKPKGHPIWLKISQSHFSTQLSNSGIIAMGVQQDFTPPEISMMMEGQLFFDGDYLLQNSRCNLLAEDPNGFAWTTEHVEIKVDGVGTEVSLGDTTETGEIISVVSVLDLSVGEHLISYRMSDALGNWSELIEFTGVVTGEAQIIDYGNFPNPFEGETLLIYELTQPLHDIVIEIFTLSGFKLHEIDAHNARVGIPLGAIGYHEVPWNGRDRNEDFVANGVYFYRIRGTLDKQELTGPVGKMVKNR